MNPAIPMVNPAAEYRLLKDEIDAAVGRVLVSGRFILGPEGEAFEHEIAAYVGVPHAVGCNSGTDALHFPLVAAGIGPGDEVIAPAHTFFATIEAIVHTGATPVLADVERDTLTLDPAAVRSLLTDRTRAIVPVHLYGQCADMDPLLEIARERGLRVVEDAAQAHGAKYKGRTAGSLGDAASFSFYFTKNLGGVGEGGFISTSDAKLAEQVRLLRHHGHVSKFEHAIVGYNLRLDELQAAVLRAKLPGLDAGNDRRRAHAAHYARLFSGSAVQVPVCRPGNEHVYHVYALRAPRRDELADHLAQRGVGTGIHYKNPGHLQPALRSVPHRVGDMKVTIEACRELISLPMYPQLSADQIEYVAAQVLEFV